MPIPKWFLIRSALETGLVFFVFLGVTVILQVLAGAYRADLAGDDEAAHYVTGLMVRSFIASNQWHEPMEFARAYYDAYPKVALGHWPPVFYVLQALWTLVFSASRESVLLMMAVLAASSATLSYGLFAESLGRAAAAVSSAVFLCMPVVQYLSSSVMAELLILTLTLLAVSAYAKYLDSGRTLHSLAFGLLAAAAILTKANGFALALVPPIAILLANKLALMRRLSFWVPLVVVALLCGPWYFFAAGIAKEGWRGSKSPKFLLGTVAGYNLNAVHQQVGSLIVLLAAIGFYAAIIRPFRQRKSVEALWGVAAATLAATLLFHSVIAPVRETRHLTAAMLLAILFAARGLLHLIESIPHLSRHSGKAALLGGTVATLTFGFESFRMFRKPTCGARQVTAVLDSNRYAGRPVLVSSPAATGEGAIVAEAALRAHTPQRRVLRASKLLAAVSWDGRGYRALAQDPAEALLSMSGAGVAVVFWQRPSGTGPVSTHHLQIAEGFRLYPNSFRKIIQADDVNTFDVYELTGHPQ